MKNMDKTERTEMILERIVEAHDITREDAELLYDETFTMVSGACTADKYSIIHDETDIAKMSTLAMMLVARMTGEFEQIEERWNSFNRGATDFDIGLIYQAAFPDRATESLNRAQMDYMRGNL